MRKTIIFTLIMALFMGAATSCKIKPGASAPASQPAASLGPPPISPTVIYKASVAPAAPIVSADAVGGNVECTINTDPLDVGFQMHDFLHLEAQTYVLCSKTPVLLLATMKVQYKTPHGWVDETNTDGHTIVFLVGPIIPMVRAYMRSIVLCYPGQWRQEVHWNGIKSDGKHFFPNPADGDSFPADFTSPVWTTDCT